jgi:hypothetical protein
MTSDKTRIGPRFRQDNGFLVRETLLRVESTIDLYIREKWLDEQPAVAKLPVVLLHGAGMIALASMSLSRTLHLLTR